MNYRHVYHAGNFADVLKHVLLSLVIEHLKQKPAPFRVIDVYAGVGRYDLEGVEAEKTKEWHDGIGRLIGASGSMPMSERLSAALAPYLAAVRSVNAGGGLRHYPGSPLVARACMRPADQLIANELHEEDFAALKRVLARAPDTKVLKLDAAVAIKSLLPPKERRGIVLIDPPFEAPDEFARIAQITSDALARFSSGIYIVWYPVKSPVEVSKFLRRMRALAPGAALNITLMARARDQSPGLAETGVLVLNPPYRLAETLDGMLPELARLLAQGTGSGSGLEIWQAQVAEKPNF